MSSDRNRQGGVDYQINVTSSCKLMWESGQPYLADDKKRFCISKVGCWYAISTCDRNDGHNSSPAN